MKIKVEKEKSQFILNWDLIGDNIYKSKKIILDFIHLDF